MENIEKLKPGVLALQEKKNNMLINERLNRQEQATKKLEELSNTAKREEEKRSAEVKTAKETLTPPFPELKLGHLGIEW